VNADCQKTENWYVEVMENPEAKSGMVLYPTPGLKVFATLPDSPVRGEAYINGRFFAIGGAKLCEVTAGGAVTVLGNVVSDGLPAYIAVGQGMLAIVSAGHLYALVLGTNAFSEIDTTTGVALQGRVSQVGYSDGYFIALLANSDKFQISALLDATSWDPLDIAQVSVFPDNVVGMVVDHREIWALGQKATVPYANTGNPLFPYDVIPGSYIEQGIIAQASIAKLDNSIFALGGDERGAGVAWRAQGYLPARISNHAVENAWQGYAAISDAIGFSYQDQGHSFYVLQFPTPSKTWAYDVATGMWHERSSMVGGIPQAWLPQCHAYAFGMHLVGDRLSGNIYQMSIAFNDEAGINIRRVRRAPHVSTEQQWIRHNALQLDVEPGLGPQPPLLDGNGQFRDPVMMLRWSDDGGHTWSNERQLACGQAGQFKKRVIQRRLGRSRDRVYEISTTDAIPWRIVDAYLDATPGYQPVERLSRQMGKMA